MTRTALFPLRCSVEMFVDPLAPDAVTRAKEAAVLFDNLVFEVGLLDVTITGSGSTQWWTPPHQLTPELLAGTRKPIPLGSDVVFAVGAQDGPGIPAKELRTILSDKLSARYVAEFHTGILDELAQHAPDWVGTIATGGNNPSQSTTVGKAIADLNWTDFRASELMSDLDSWLRSFVYQGFNHDLVLAADLGATFSVTNLFAPMLTQRGLAAQHSGSEALSIVIPNLGKLPWEAVGEFRDHPGSQEARSMLIEFENRATQQEPEDAYEWLRSVSQQVTGAYAAAMAHMARSLPENLAKEALLTGVSFIPAVGPVVATASSMSQALRDVMRERRSWCAALWELRTG